MVFLTLGFTVTGIGVANRCEGKSLREQARCGARRERGEVASERRRLEPCSFV
jgi:hypothetical protein